MINGRNQQIYEEYKNNVSLDDLSSKYKLAPSTIESIINQWKRYEGDGFYRRELKNDLISVIASLPIASGSQTRIYNGLMRAGINSVDKLKDKTYDDICAVRYMGKKYAEILLNAGFLKDSDTSDNVLPFPEGKIKNTPHRKDYYDRVNSNWLIPVDTDRNSGDAYLNVIHAEIRECQNAMSDAMAYMQRNDKSDDPRFAAANLVYNALGMFDTYFDDYAIGAPAKKEYMNDGGETDYMDKPVMLLRMLNGFCVNLPGEIINKNPIQKIVKENITL